MNPLVTQIFFGLFYTLLFAVACSVVANAVVHVIREYYAAKMTMISITSDTEQRDAIAQRVTARMAATLGKK